MDEDKVPGQPKDKVPGQSEDKAPGQPEDGAWTFPADHVNAFVLVTEDRRREASELVSRMSGRDLAVLSFWLKELSDVVDMHVALRRI